MTEMPGVGGHSVETPGIKGRCERDTCNGAKYRLIRVKASSHMSMSASGVKFR